MINVRLPAARPLIVALLLLALVSLQFGGGSSWTSGRVGGGNRGRHEKFKNERVLVCSSFGAHDDVYASLVDTLEDLLLPPSSRPTPPPSSNSDVDAPSPPVLIYGFGLRYGLTQVVEELGVYTSPGSIWYTKNQAMAGVDGGWEGRGADVVVFGTCEIDMKNYSEELWKIWLARPADRKFNLICIVHNAGDFGWAEKYSGDWARVGALRILPISQHVVNAQRKNFINFADAPDRYHLGYSHIPVEAHIPILPIERFSGFTAHGKHTGQYIFSPGGDGFGELRTDVSEVEGGVLDRTWGRRDGKMLRDVCIQGNFEAARRNYVIIFADLEAELDLDPSAWGYLPPTSPSAPFIPADADNFILHLAGNGKDDFVPSRLKRVVLIHKALSYPDFFSLMGSMDMVLPAFKDGGGYYDRQASSTVAMAMQCETPLLVTPRILEAYSYLTPKTTVIRPQSISEVSALKILRTSRFAPPALGYTHDVERSYDDASGSTLQKEGGEVVEMHASVRREAEEMIARGWTTKERDWREFKKGIREKNREVAKRIVLDM